MKTVKIMKNILVHRKYQRCVTEAVHANLQLSFVAVSPSRVPVGEEIAWSRNVGYCRGNPNKQRMAGWKSLTGDSDF